MSRMPCGPCTMAYFLNLISPSSLAGLGDGLNSRIFRLPPRRPSPDTEGDQRQIYFCTGKICESAFVRHQHSKANRGGAGKVRQPETSRPWRKCAAWTIYRSIELIREKEDKMLFWFDRDSFKYLKKRKHELVSQIWGLSAEIIMVLTRLKEAITKCILSSMEIIRAKSIWLS